MTEKFSIEDLFIKIIPGGTLVGILYFVYENQLNLELIKGLDFFYTFLFFTFSFLLGEIVQTISHELEFLVNLFFKFNKPSQVFLYRDNPILRNENIRFKVIEYLSINNSDLINYDKSYKKLRWFYKNKELQDKCQSFFWELYTNVSNEDEIKIFNRHYLLARGIMIVFLISIIVFTIEQSLPFVICFSISFLIFLWRVRGMARTLVLKIILLNLKDK